MAESEVPNTTQSGYSDEDEPILPQEFDGDVDSAYEETPPSLTSLKSSILAFQHENGRTYHALSEGKYALPNDEQENDRLDLQHHLFLLTLDGELCLCPKVEGANRVLDIGTGTGIWAIEYAENHPGAEVIGVDLSPIQPNFVPPNCTFEVDDLEKEWTWTRPFDFIFCRMMLASFRDFPAIIKTAYNNLSPGGYLEIHDFSYPALSDDGTLRSDSALSDWCRLCVEAAAAQGRPVFPPAEYAQYLRDAGFQDVVQVVRKWPTNRWPKDKRHKELGMWCLANLDPGLEGISVAHFTRGLGWNADDVLAFCAKVRRDMRDVRVHAYFQMYFVYGRKPMGAQLSEQVNSGGSGNHE